MDGAARWQKTGGHVLGVEARLHRVATQHHLFLGEGSGLPSATASCQATRSWPVMASVTGCSTCNRVFISMKKNSSPQSRNSMVPAPDRRWPWPPPRPPRPWRGAGQGRCRGGASSITFWWRRCKEQSRPQIDGVAEGIGKDLHLHVTGAGR